jgi:hypothetical protein
VPTSHSSVQTFFSPVGVGRQSFPLKQTEVDTHPAGPWPGSFGMPSVGRQAPYCGTLVNGAQVKSLGQPGSSTKQKVVHTAVFCQGWHRRPSTQLESYSQISPSCAMPAGKYSIAVQVFFTSSQPRRPA